MVDAGLKMEYLDHPSCIPNVLRSIPKNDLNQFELEIETKKWISPDTILFRFKFPDPTMLLGLPIANHLKIFMPLPADADEDDMEPCRPYTPISDMNTAGHVDFVIKVYKPNEQF